jgi:membrane-associated protease RseP (regulator of RpoE activity)
VALGLGLAAAVAIETDPFFGDGSQQGATTEDDGSLEDDAPAALDEDEGRPWLGIVGVPFPAGDGIRVAHVVDGSPAADAGIAKGDLITEVDGEPVDSVRGLAKIIEQKSVGDAVALTVIRDGLHEPEGESETIDVTLGTRPDDIDFRERFEDFGELRERIEERIGDVFSHLEDRFDRFLGGEFSYLNDDAEVVTVTVDVGQVKAVTGDQLIVTLNSGDDKTFAITDDTRMPADLAEGDRVTVITVDGEVWVVCSGAGGRGPIHISPGNGRFHFPPGLLPEKPGNGPRGGIDGFEPPFPWRKYPDR